MIQPSKSDVGGTAPRTLQYAAVGTLIAAALQVLVGVLLFLHRSEFALAQAQLHPDFTPSRVQDRADGIVVGGLGTHLVLCIAYLVLARGVVRGQPNARLRLTALLVLATIVGTISAARFGADVSTIRVGIQSVQAVSTALRLVVLYLLWMPAASRAEFTRATS